MTHNQRHEHNARNDFSCGSRGENGYCLAYGLNCAGIQHDLDRCLKAKREDQERRANT